VLLPLPFTTLASRWEVEVRPPNAPAGAVSPPPIRERAEATAVEAIFETPAIHTHGRIDARTRVRHVRVPPAVQRLPVNVFVYLVKSKG
jgi:hypothetical protein